MTDAIQYLKQFEYYKQLMKDGTVDSPFPPFPEYFSTTARLNPVEKPVPATNAMSSSVGILPYNRFSVGAKMIAKGLPAWRLNTDHFYNYSPDAEHFYQSTREPGYGPLKTVINWGNGHPIRIAHNSGIRIINKPDAIAKVVSKISFFKMMKEAKDGPRIPDCTNSAKEAMKWIEEGHEVMARQITEGKMGEGILFYEEDNMHDFLQAPLFVKYILNIAEYRAHCAFGEIIHWQKKDLSDAAREAGNVDFRVRSHKKGFYFMDQGEFRVPADVELQAEKAMKATPLDFVAFDIIYNKYYDQAYVLEGNSAPGLDEGKTAEKYIAAFKKAISA